MLHIFIFEFLKFRILVIFNFHLRIGEIGYVIPTIYIRLAEYNHGDISVSNGTP